MDYIFSDRIAALKPSAIREILKATADPGVIPFAAGNPAPEAFPVEAIRSFSRDILEENPIAALQYGISEGYGPLRELVRRRMSDKFRSVADSDDVIIVSGAQQGSELTCKILCNEGDTVLCENPSFIGVLNALRSYNVNLRGIPMEEDGVSIGEMERALREEKNVKLMYLIPNFQNPTGITMSLAKRRAVYELAKRYGVVIIEDNPYGDLRFAGEDLPNIKSMDTEGLVVYCGSFSKILSPGLRVGFVIAAKPLLQKMIVAKQVSDVHTSMLSQMLAERFMSHFDLEGHIGKIRQIYRHKCARMIEGMEAHFDPRIRFTRPDGGLFLWCTLPQGADMPAYCRKAADAGVAVVPGVAFNASPNDPSDSFRLNYSTPRDEQIVRGIEILGSISIG